MRCDGVKTPWSLRDHPAVLAISVIGVLIVLFTLGSLTTRIGLYWIRLYIHRQTSTDW